MQGFNMGRYVPPDLEGLTTGNKLHGKKPPGIHGITQTVRFELPFNIFCSCSAHIAQGTRFNAIKTKTGSYYTTPIFTFRFKHSTCGGSIEIQTDPKNTAYVVLSGAKKKAIDEEKEAGFIRIPDVGEEKKEDPFERKERGVVNRTEAKVGAERVEELRGLSERQWKDPYEHSRKIRRVFRAERKVLAAKAASNEALADRAGLHIELLDATPEDGERAKLIEFGKDDEESIANAHSRPLFKSAEKVEKLRITPKMRSRDVPEMTKESLARDLRRNTRAAVDPFLKQDWSRATKVARLKRKEREEERSESGGEREEVETNEKPSEKPSTKTPALSLVDYSSEDD